MEVFVRNWDRVTALMDQGYGLKLQETATIPKISLIFLLKSSARLYILLTLIWNMTTLLLQMWLNQTGHTFARISYIHFFSDCTVSADGLKISSAIGNYPHESFIETECSLNKDAKSTWLVCQANSYEVHPGENAASEIIRRKALVRGSAECTFYGKVTVDFFSCDWHLLSGVTLGISLRRSLYDFSLISDDAGKNWKNKNYRS